MGNLTQNKAMQERLVTENINIDSQGYGVIARLVMKDRRLGIGAKALYAYICSHTGAGDGVFPDRDVVCHDLGINKDTFQKYLRELVRFDYVRVVKSRHQGRFATNTYVIVKNPSPPTKGGGSNA